MHFSPLSQSMIQLICIGPRRAMRVKWLTTPTNKSEPPLNMPWIMAGRCEKPERERTFGDVCIVRITTVMAALGQYTQHPRMQSIMRRTSVAPWIDALTSRK
jgi:hypothetical protein